MNRQEEKCYVCRYCNTSCKSSFMLREHISYGHRSLVDFERSNIYKNLLTRIKKTEEINENLLARIKNIEETKNYQE